MTEGALPLRYAEMPYRLAFNRDEAAFYIHVAVPTWNRLVREGIMPQPKRIGIRSLWDRREIEMFFANIPHVGQLSEEADNEEAERAKWA